MNKTYSTRPAVTLIAIFATLFAVSTLSFCSEVEPAPRPAPQFTISHIIIEGAIDDENVLFNMQFEAETHTSPASIPLVSGNTAYRGGRLPRGAELSYSANCYWLTTDRRRVHSVQFEFAGQPAREGDWRSVSFDIPPASVRQVRLICDRDDLEINFPGALSVKKEKMKDGKTLATAYLGVGRRFVMRWKPEIKKLEAERVVECEANMIAVAGVGALHMDVILNYRLLQGSLNQLLVALPPDVNITQVNGEDIQDWSIDRANPDQPVLSVALNRHQETLYALRINGEMMLPEFPCSFDLPVFTPRDVIRANGFLTVGTDSAIKILVIQAPGLTQVDQALFPLIKREKADAAERVLPQRRPFTYQFAGMPFVLTIEADDIVTALTADSRLVLSVVDNDAALHASVELDVRDAPAREAAFITDPAWTAAGVTGADIADYDVRDEAAARIIRVYFRNAVLGRTLVDLRLEHSLGAEAAVFTLPRFSVRDAKSERGYLVMSGEKGLRLKVEKPAGLIEVHTGSTPMRVPDAQLAFRFKDASWTGTVEIERTRPVVHSEVFHLLALGDGALYGSALITYHVSGAPMREFSLTIPEEYQNVEFTGRDVRGWEHTNSLWKVSLQEKIMGDYTLLVSYDRPVNYAGGEISMGGVRTGETESETGYIVASSATGLKIEELSRDPSVIRIDRNEVPEAYALLVKDPFLASYKYVQKPHLVNTAATRYETEPMLSQVADHVSLQTDISRDGETVSTATYFVKNASGQYLVLSLPENAKLWSSSIIEADGRRVDVSALQDGVKLLVPVPRPRDLNTPIQVSVVYAQNHGQPGAMGGSILMRAPAILQSPAPFTRWTVNLPESLSVCGTGGNVVRDRAPAAGALGATVLAVVRAYGALISGAPGRLILAVVLFAITWFAAWRSGSTAMTIAILVIGGIPALFFFLAGPGSGSLINEIMNELLTPIINPRSITFSRVVSLPEDQPLFLTLRLAPAWLGASASPATLTLSLLAAIVVLLTSGRARAGVRTTARALALMFLVVGLAQLTMGRIVLVGLLTLVPPVLCALFLLKLALNAGRRRRAARNWAEGSDISPFDKSAPEPAGPGPGNSGMAGLPCILLLLAAVSCALIFSAPRAMAQKASTPPRPVALLPPALLPAIPYMEIETIDGVITAPETVRDADKSVVVEMELVCRVTDPTSGIILPPDCVLTDFKSSDSRNLSISAGPGGYTIEAGRSDEYRAKFSFKAPIREVNGQWTILLRLPPRLKNRFILKLPESGMDVRSDTAVYCKTADDEPGVTTEALFGAESAVSFTWRPQMRKTEQEQTVFFAEVNSLFTFEPGVVNGSHLVRYQIAQGEIRKLLISVPEPMNVTSVSGEGIGTWRFDPAARAVEAILKNPASGAYSLVLATQTPYEGLPYSAEIGAPLVQDAARQRGAVALAAPETVQIVVNPRDGLNAMNISDFAPEAAPSAESLLRAPLRRAFRYHQLPAGAIVKVEQVLPEIRVEEKGSLSIADERIVLATQLRVTIAKSGVFSLRLDIPDGFDLESLTGEDVSHWDEIKDEEHGIIVHFNKPALGARVLNLVLARMEKGIEETIAAPRVKCSGAVKHTGTLVVSGERGVRLTTIRREGVSEINPRELGIQQQGALAFSLLRPEWTILLKAEVLMPVIKPEMLQRVDISEGMLKGRCYLRYRIENAGCKVFRLQAPYTNTLLSISGADIAKVQVSDPARGIWQVTLHNKVENSYSLAAAYQVPFDPGTGEVTLTPLLPVNTDTPRGYLAVMSDGRVQIRPTGELEGLKPEESRGIPAAFGAGDLSDAILCYRTIQPDYRLPLSVIRHESADALPAQVTETRLTSVVSDDGKMLTQVNLQMNVGHLRFLMITLPGKNSRLWSAFVNGRAAAPSREDGAYRIPLEAVESGEPASVEFLYESAAEKHGFRWNLEGPRLDLPLMDITWTLHVLPNRLYHRFGGTLELVDAGNRQRLSGFEASDYRITAQRRVSEDLQKAKTVMAKGEEYAKQGKQKLAKRSLESAINYSHGQSDLNEDARVQYHNLIQEQAVVGLVDRRNAVRQSQNIQLDQPAPQMQQARQQQAEISSKEDTSLRMLSERLLRQQEAAAGVDQAIRVTVPESGRRLEFGRDLQVEPDAPMTITYYAAPATGVGRLISAGAMLVFFALFMAAMKTRKKQT